MSSKTIYPPRHVEVTGEKFGYVTVKRRGPNHLDGTAQWWVVNALNVDPQKEYLLPRRTLWRKCTGLRPSNGEGMQIHYPAIYRSVINHFKWIYHPHNPARYHGYRGMPAYEPWNPKNGPLAIANAVRDILKEIGNKPGKDYNLHVMDKRVGFWLGNLMWIPVVQHKRAEMINRLIEENAQLKQEIASLKFLFVTRDKR